MVPVILLAEGCSWLLVESAGTPVPRARSSGSDALWIGHAWVDGRHSQADLDGLLARVRSAGIRELFVHIGPLSDDGSLDRSLRPNARISTAQLEPVPGIRFP